MKKTLILLALIVCAFYSIAQEYTTTRKVVPLLTQQSFYLNGGIKASMGGKSRVYYAIDLPPNTIGWVYSFSTSLGDQGTKNLKLAAQLTKVVDPSGITAIVTEALFAPSGAASADIYMCDRRNIELFMQKMDNCRYYESGSRLNFTHGIVPVKDLRQGTFYLGVKNPSASTGINVFLEVAAIVEERVQVEKKESQTKGELYAQMGWNAYLQGDYNKCIEMSKKALDYDANLAIAKCNIALCYLVLNKSDYLDSYIDAIACCKKSMNPKGYLQAALKDIYDVKQKTTIPNGDEIITLLKQQINSL